MVNNKVEKPIVFAAGGILLKEEAKTINVALVHRPKYDDWTLPKGKQKPGEPLDKTALREVSEETGYCGYITAFAGTIDYELKQVYKIVLFWIMNKGKKASKIASKKEIDQVIWISLKQALQKLTYERDRQILKKAMELLGKDYQLD